jgi:hypothetical protein
LHTRRPSSSRGKQSTRAVVGGGRGRTSADGLLVNVFSRFVAILTRLTDTDRSDKRRRVEIRKSYTRSSLFLSSSLPFLPFSALSPSICSFTLLTQRYLLPSNLPQKRPLHSRPRPPLFALQKQEHPLQANRQARSRNRPEPGTLPKATARALDAAEEEKDRGCSAGMVNGR